MMVFKLLSIFVISSSLVTLASSKTDVQPKTNVKTLVQLIKLVEDEFYSGTSTQNNRVNCPICDSSVYSYCSDKLLHDACCCLNPYEHRLPPQCRYADCSFLHANSCREHKLITACCCSYAVKRSKS